MNLGPIEMLLIVGIVLLLFGPSRLPSLGKSIGEAIRSFKKGLNTDEIDVTDESKRNQELNTGNAQNVNTTQKQKETTKS
jgi:sec-independent protein translocase protein TatA